MGKSSSFSSFFSFSWHACSDLGARRAIRLPISCSTGQVFIYIFSPSPWFPTLCLSSTATWSGKKFSLYSLGRPIRCSVDAADILRARLAELDGGCASEDELELEGDRKDEEVDEELSEADEELSEMDKQLVRLSCSLVAISNTLLAC